MRELEDAVARAVAGIASGVETAPAKINLALHVVSRRNDGYHLIDSLIVFAEIADLLSAVPSTSGRQELAIGGPLADEFDVLHRSDENLVMRAAGAILQAAKTRPRQLAKITLTKCIPIAAGLGGGSADAAAALRLLNRHWKLELSTPQLAKIGLPLGADVPMCLFSKPAIAQGIGETLTLANGIPRLPLVLVNPRIPLSTASVYSSLEEAKRSSLPPLPGRFSSIMSFVIWLRQTRNDLSQPAKIHTALAEQAVNAVSSDPDCLFARMSGSGATAFGIFPNLSVAERAATQIQQKRPNWWVIATETAGS